MNSDYWPPYGVRRPVAAALVAVAILALAVASVEAQEASLALEPMEIVVLIDESTSLSEEHVADEARAASLLASLELSDRSSVAVLGFASAHAASNTLAVRDLCDGFRPLSDAGERRVVAQCAHKAARRVPGQGDNTDHYTALKAALALFDPGASATQRTIFLLTDGDLDPGRGTFGETDGEARENALRLIRDEIGPEAERLGVQIWPLGFGLNLDDGLLRTYAELGAGANPRCGEFAVTPRAEVVDSVDQVLESLITAAANARCQRVVLSGAGSDSAEIPPPTTDGAVGVTRPIGSSVTFRLPDGTEVSSAADLPDDRYTMIETDEAVVIRFRDTGGGTWSAEIDGRPAPRLLGLWEARIDARAIVSPQAEPGETVPVELQVLDRTGVVNDFDFLDLSDLVVEARTEDGPVIVDPVSLDGGRLVSSFIMPACPATVAVRSFVNIQGFTDASIPAEVLCQAGGAVIVDLAGVPPRQDLEPGDTYRAELTYSNQTNSVRILQIAIEGVQPTGWTVEGESRIVAQPVSNDSVDVALRYNGEDRSGEYAGQLVVSDTTDGAPVAVQREGFGGRFVEEPFPWLRVLVAVTAALAAGLYVVGWLRRRLALRRSDGLVAILTEDGVELDRHTVAGRRWLGLQIEPAGRTYRFDPDPLAPRYRVKRRAAGLLWPATGKLIVDDPVAGSSRRDSSPAQIETEIERSGHTLQIEVRDDYDFMSGGGLDLDPADHIYQGADA